MDENLPASAPDVIDAPRFVGGAPRARHVSLAYPLEYGGRVLAEVQIRRMTVADLMAYQALIKAEPDANHRVPIFADADGALLPEVVIRALDADDWNRMNEEADRFLSPLTAESTPPTSASGDSSSAGSAATA
jgi:hypothetical protein